MSVQDLLPNFFIIGAAKAGTTSLFNILSEHPMIYGSPVKEPCFFSDDNRFEKGFDWYQQTFFKDVDGYAVRMEASPVYLTWSEKVVTRLLSIYKDSPPKIAGIFRDPVERAYSHYWHRVRMGQEPLSFIDALKNEEMRLSQNWDELVRSGNGKYGYFRAGCYASRLQPYLKNFPRENMIFLLLDDLKPENIGPAIKNTLDFLDVEVNFPVETKIYNSSTKTRKPWFSRAYWRLKRTFLKPFYRKLIPNSYRLQIYNKLFPSAEYPQMPAEAEYTLRLRYQHEIKQLEDIMQRDLSRWLPS